MAALINQVEWCRHAAQTVGVGTAQEQYSIDWHINSAPKNGQTPGGGAGWYGWGEVGWSGKKVLPCPSGKPILTNPVWMAGGRSLKLPRVTCAVIYARLVCAVPKILLTLCIKSAISYGLCNVASTASNSGRFSSSVGMVPEIMIAGRAMRAAWSFLSSSTPVTLGISLSVIKRS